MNINDKLRELSGGKMSSWMEEAPERIASWESWRRNSGKIALHVLQTLRDKNMSQTELATRMGVSRQQVSKIVKGQENFTLETIYKLETALNIKLITIEPWPDKKKSSSKKK
ncbi:helix-turn-helix transcriptional regulator [uncultured Chitinophaga sp.]|uniref:helix-turn-helix transcriptional regulator n=1 Tax=uncultured Chitinophaga sp. TaxID=339340 RepID=UPI0025DE01A8|nr:helix-turn-helix transcriptional regulator [uncultured Chitinophaga sp.]